MAHGLTHLSWERPGQEKNPLLLVPFCFLSIALKPGIPPIIFGNVRKLINGLKGTVD